MKIGIAAAAAIVFIAAGASAAPADEPVEQAATARPEQASAVAATDTGPASQDEKKICRTEKATGSLTRRNRICLTETQWREVHDRTRRGVSELQSSGSGAPRCISAMDVACGAPSAGGVPGM